LFFCFTLGVYQNWRICRGSLSPRTQWLEWKIDIPNLLTFRWFRRFGHFVFLDFKSMCCIQIVIWFWCLTNLSWPWLSKNRITTHQQIQRDRCLNLKFTTACAPLFIDFPIS
jgi:hypothetical protein